MDLVEEKLLVTNGLITARTIYVITFSGGVRVPGVGRGGYYRSSFIGPRSKKNLFKIFIEHIITKFSGHFYGRRGYGLTYPVPLPVPIPIVVSGGGDSYPLVHCDEYGESYGYGVRVYGNGYDYGQCYY